MKELHALVDFENVQPSLEALAKLAPGFTDVWLFHGPHQAKQAQAFAASHERVTLVPRSGQGPNALDFHVAFYLGYVAAKHPDAELVVVANDRGYDPMLAHARMLKFRARRVGYKGPVAKKAVVVKPAAPAAVPVAAKKAVAKKAVAKKVVAKQAAPKPAATGKVAAVKKAPAAKKAPAVKKAVTKKAACTQAHSQTRHDARSQAARSHCQGAGQDGRQGANQAEVIPERAQANAGQGQHGGRCRSHGADSAEQGRGASAGRSGYLPQVISCYFDSCSRSMHAATG